jgi:hypothetical protein
MYVLIYEIEMICMFSDIKLEPVSRDSELLA